MRGAPARVAGDHGGPEAGGHPGYADLPSRHACLHDLRHRRRLRLGTRHGPPGSTSETGRMGGLRRQGPGLRPLAAEPPEVEADGEDFLRGE